MSRVEELYHLFLGCHLSSEVRVGIGMGVEISTSISIGVVIVATEET